MQPGGANFQYSTETGRLLSSGQDTGTISYGYDDSGSLTQQTGALAATFTYTPERLIETSVVAGVATRYTYDADGLRTTKTTGGTTTYYLHGPGGEVLSEYEETNGQLAWTRDYLYLGDRLIGVRRAGAMMSAGPNPFAFTSQLDVPAGQVVSSAPVLITGIVDELPLRVSGAGAYRICATASCPGSPAFTTAPATIRSGSYVQLQVTSSTTPGETVTTVVTIGLVAAGWEVTTGATVTDGLLTVSCTPALNNGTPPPRVGQAGSCLASVTGDWGALEYRFDLVDMANGSSTILRDFAASATLGWTPTQPGPYRLRAGVRRVGSPGGAEATWESGTFRVQPAGWASALGVEQCLYPGQGVTSADGRFTFVYQADGNLVLYGPAGALWWTGTDGMTATVVRMQADGNLVVFSGSAGVWQSGTAGHDGATLWVQTDGNVVIYAPNGTPLAWTGTSGEPGPEAAAGPEADAATASVAGVLMMGDGNLRGPSGSGSGASRLWWELIPLLGMLALLSAGLTMWRRFRLSRSGDVARQARSLVRLVLADSWLIARRVRSRARLPHPGGEPRAGRGWRRAPAWRAATLIGLALGLVVLGPARAEAQPQASTIDTTIWTPWVPCGRSRTRRGTWCHGTTSCRSGRSGRCRRPARRSCLRGRSTIRRRASTTSAHGITRRGSDGSRRSTRSTPGRRTSSIRSDGIGTHTRGTTRSNTRIQTEDGLRRSGTSPMC